MATTEEGSGGRKRGVESYGMPAPGTGTFAIRGEYWTLGYGGTTFMLKDVKGLSYIQRLLQHPGKEFHSLDLLSGPGLMNLSESDHKPSEQIEGTDSVGGLGDSGEMLDAKAKQEYKRKLRELKEELEDQRERGNHQRADQIESEIDFLDRELTRAVGIGGRDRRAGSVSERARLNVTRAIKAALQKISEKQISMGELLERSIRTGSFCSYAPSIAVSWQFSMEGPQPSGEPDATAPLLFRRGATFLHDYLDRTTFVGREVERATLRRFLDQAVGGQGSVVMIGGPAGVGKTRIAAEICAEASQRSILTYGGSCYDREDSVPFIPFVEMLEAALAQAPSPDAFRRALGKDAGEIARLMPQLRHMFADIPPPLEVSPEQSRRILFNALLKVILRTAANSPVLLVLEDLHWADEGTLSLIAHVARSISRSRVMILGTYRDNELDLVGPLSKTLNELARLQLLDRIDLPSLSQGAVAEMISALSGHEPPSPVVNLIYSNTEGNPFFVEELFKHLAERGRLTDAAGKFRRDFTLDNLDVPQSLRLLVNRHLARLSDDTRKMLGTAAIIGRSFTFELLEAATHSDTEALLDCVEEGERAGLITSTLEYPEALFQFSHELMRQAVLGELSVPRRQRLHLNVAEALERIHANTLEDHASDLAHHLWQAGKIAEADKTIKYLASAAKRAITQSAYESAAKHLKHALRVAPNLSDDRHEQSELALLIDYGVTLLALRGWSDPELGDVYKKARELCLRVGDTQSLFSVLLGLAGFHLNRAELKLCRAVVDEMNSLDSDALADKMVLTGWSMGVAQFFMGEFADAHASFQQGIRYYDKQRHRGGIAFRIGQDLCASCLVFDAMTLLILGYPDQAEIRLQESLSLARELGYPFTLAVCLTMAAKYCCIRRDFSRLPGLVRETTTLAREYGFAFYEQGITAYEIIGFAAEGKLEELNASFERAKRSSDLRYELALTWARSALAEAVANLGRFNAAARFLTEASEIMKRNDERYVESEIHRIQGGLILKRIESTEFAVHEVRSARAEAERNFRKALEIAQRQGARLFQLRAATSLSRLLIDTGRGDEARGILREIYDSFSEGLEAPDLKMAKAVLEQCAPAPRS